MWIAAGNYNFSENGFWTSVLLLKIAISVFAYKIYMQREIEI